MWSFQKLKKFILKSGENELGIQSYPEEEGEEEANDDELPGYLLIKWWSFSASTDETWMAAAASFQRPKQEEMDGGDGGDCFLTLPDNG